MALFPLSQLVKAELADTLNLPSKILQLGDGYEQLRSDGLNGSTEIWDVTVILPDSARSDILQAFLIDHGQYKIFQWQSPRDKKPQDYRILGKASGTKRNGGGAEPIFFTRTMQFKGLPKKIDVPLTSTTYSFPGSIATFPVSTTYNF